MAIHQIARYRVKPAAVERVKTAVREFVDYVRANEPGTRWYVAWQEKDDPTAFVHFFIFDEETARNIHGESTAVRRFESIYSPELVGGCVVFTDYESVAANADSR